MLIDNGDGTFTCGPLDVLLILLDVAHGTYHAALFAERPLPGSASVDVRDVELVRLECRLSHTRGAPTLEEAQQHLAALCERFKVPETNVWKDRIVAWNGDIQVLLFEPNWLKAENPR